MMGNFVDEQGVYFQKLLVTVRGGLELERSNPFYCQQIVLLCHESAQSLDSGTLFVQVLQLGVGDGNDSGVFQSMNTFIRWFLT